MIAANELRINNWFIPISDNGEEFEPRQIKASEFLLLSNKPEKAIQIPLTEEWILKSGLKGKENGYPYKFLKGFLKIRNGVYFFKYYDIEIELPFVHQLQNLYFALTGIELDVNL